MIRITRADWSFERICAVDDARATKLESVGSPENLLESLIEALDQAIGRIEFRNAVDSKDNAFSELRAIIQFQVPPELYDWFFNGRTGYRAQFWIDPEIGMDFNERITDALAEVLRRRLPATVKVRRINVEFEGNSRQETDAGSMEITRNELAKSLAPAASKIWICERLYSPDGRPIKDIGFATLSAADRSPAKLCVPRWANATNSKTGEKGEGLRAPFPSPENSWLDLKGGFLDAVGNSNQIKSQNERANQLHKYGWT